MVQLKVIGQEEAGKGDKGKEVKERERSKGKKNRKGMGNGES